MSPGGAKTILPQLDRRVGADHTCTREDIVVCLHRTSTHCRGGRALPRLDTGLRHDAHLRRPCAADAADRRQRRGLPATAHGDAPGRADREPVPALPRRCRSRATSATSYWQRVPTVDLVVQRIPSTLLLALTAIFLAAVCLGAARDRGGRQARQRARPLHRERLAARRLGRRVLARADADRLRRGRPRPPANLGLRHAGSRHPARPSRSRPGRSAASPRSSAPRCSTSWPGRTSRSRGPRALPSARVLRARAEERRHPDHHARRPGGGRAAGRLHDHRRDGVRLAGHRAAWRRRRC